MYCEHFSSIWLTKNWNSELFLKREQNSKTRTKLEFRKTFSEKSKNFEKSEHIFDIEKSSSNSKIVHQI